MSKPFTVQEANHLLTVQNQIIQLDSQSIKTKHGDTQATALREEFAAGVLTNAGELLSAYLLVKTEYETIIRGVAVALRRASEVNAAVAEIRAKEQQGA